MRSPLLLILIGLAIMASAAGAYFLGTLKNSPEPVNTSSSTSVAVSPSVSSSPIPPLGTPSEPLADWKSYTNTEAGYRLKYPQNWILRQESYNDPLNEKLIKVTTIENPSGTRKLVLGVKYPTSNYGITGRTGVGAGDFMLGDMQNITGIPIRTSNLVYEGKVKEVYYSGKLGPGVISLLNRQAIFEFICSKMDCAEDDVRTDNDFNLVTQILSSFELSSETSVPESWKTFSDGAYDFSFKYPATLIPCCAISGPASGKPEQIIVLADKATTLQGTDAPFNGLAVYVEPNPSNTPFSSYIEEEKRALLEQGRRDSGQDNSKTGVSQTLTLSKTSGVILKGFSWDRIERYYFSFPNDKKILIVSKLKKSVSADAFDPAFDQILSTFRFTN